MKNTIVQRGAVLSAVTLLASAAVARGPVVPTDGDILLTSEQATAVRIISGFGPSVAQTLLSFPANYRPAGIALAPDGNYYIANGIAPIPDAGSGIIKVENLFSGAASFSNLVSGSPLDNPIDVIWDDLRGEVITVSNPGASSGNHGLYGATLAGGLTTIYDRGPVGMTRPTYTSGRSIERLTGYDDLLVTDINGGSLPLAPNDGNPSAIWRFRYDGMTNNYDLDPTPWIDFTDVFGPGNHLTIVRGITAGPGGMYITDVASGSVHRLGIDAMTGDWDGSIVTLVTGLDQPEEIIYNRYTDRIVVNEIVDNAANSRIIDFNTDGSDVQLLSTGDHGRGLFIVPTPGALALLSVAGLFAARRRRG